MSVNDLGNQYKQRETAQKEPKLNNNSLLVMAPMISMGIGGPNRRLFESINDGDVAAHMGFTRFGSMDGRRKESSSTFFCLCFNARWYYGDKKNIFYHYLI